MTRQQAQHQPFLDHLPEEQREPFAETAHVIARNVHRLVGTADWWFVDMDDLADEAATATAIVKELRQGYIWRAESAFGECDADTQANAALVVAALDDHEGAARRYVLSVLAEVRR